jgi:HlyD family secretion protein
MDDGPAPVKLTRAIGYLFTLAIPVAAVAGGTLYMMRLGQTGPETLTYDTVEVAKGNIRKIVASSGPVRALVTVSVGSQLSGQIDKVQVDFNSEVKPGDVLATLDARTYAARTAQAKADLVAAEAALANQNAALAKAKAVLTTADRTIQRQKSLAQKGFASQQTLDNAVRDQDVAEADIAVAQAQIASAKATIAQRKAALDQAQIDLDRAEIRSPISGTVISRTVDPGQTVAASLQAPELFKIAQDLSRIRIEAQVNEADVGAVAEGNSVMFNVDAYPDREFKGRVTQVRLAATELNNVVTYTVIIEAMNEDRRLFPGMTANVQIESANRDGVLRVANDAFRFRPRTEQSEGSSSAGSEASRRSERMLSRMRDDLQLTEPQVAALREEMTKLSEEMRGGNQPAGMTGPTFDPSVFRQKLSSRIDQVLAPTLSEEQSKLYENWKRGRETTRPNALWVLTAGNIIERRVIRSGLADDKFTEIVSGEIEEGDRVVIRAREASK